MSDETFAGALASLSSESSSTESAESPSASSTESSGTAAAAPVAESPATAETTTAAPVENAQPTDPRGPVPYDRFQEVIQARQRAEQQMQQLSWAQGIDPQHGQVMAQFVERFRQDPWGTLLLELENAPPEVRASAGAKWMRSARGQQVEDLRPEADLQTADGQLVYSDSQQQKLMDWYKRQWLSEVQQQMQPLQQFHQQQQAQMALAEAKSNAMQWANQTLTQWRSRPHFTEHERDIHAAMKANPKLGLAEAYVDILQTKVLPKLSAQERSSVVAQMQQKAQAGTVNPSRSAVAQPAKPQTFKEAFAQASAESRAR